MMFSKADNGEREDSHFPIFSRNVGSISFIQDAADFANQDGADPRGILGSGDIEDVQFLEAVKGLIDGAVKLAGTEKGIGARIMAGLLRKTGMVDVSTQAESGQARCAEVMHQGVDRLLFTVATTRW